MSKELTPITEFPVAAALPDYLDIGGIGVDVGLVRKIARLGCFGEVEIGSYSGSTTSYDVGIGGTAGLDMASASATNKANIAPRGDFSMGGRNQYSEDDVIFPRIHDTPTLCAKLNIPEIQQRLQHSRIPARDTKAWAKQLDGGLSEAIRKAATAHLLLETAAQREAVVSGILSMAFVVLTAAGELSAVSELPAISYAIASIGLAGALSANNLAKLHHWRNVKPLRDVCFSVAPGPHLDRYAAVYALTKARRLIRPMKK